MVRVTAAEAATLVDRHERIIRAHIADGSLRAIKDGGAWRIDPDDLATIPGWRVDHARLAQLQERDSRTAESLASRVSTLERQLRAAETRIRILEARLSAGAHGGGITDTSPDSLSARSDRAIDMYPYSDIGYSETPESTHTRPYTGILSEQVPSHHAGAFKDHAEAGRWLALHSNMSALTPRSWPAWRATPLTPRDVLGYALELRREADRTGNHRISWRLHQCGDPACVCVEMLPPA